MPSLFVRAGLVFLAVVAVLSSFGTEAPKRINEDSVKQIINEVAAALKANDAKKLKAHLSPDFVNVTPSGRIQDREGLLSVFEGRTMEHLTYDVQDLKIRVYGDAAVATYVVSTKYRRRGQEGSAKFATTDVLAMVNGLLKVVSSHTVLVAGPEPRPSK